MKARFLAAALALLAGCRVQSAEEALDAYRQAVAKKDAQRVRELSDAPFRAAFDEDAVRAALAEGRGPIPPVTAGRERARFVLEGGEEVELVREDGAWRVAAGGVEPARFDTPERALETFFRAARAGKLSVVRQAIPSGQRAALGSDEALSKHLADTADRILRARTRIGSITPGRAVIRGGHADLTYGPGLSATFEREGSGWVIVDLE